MASRADRQARASAGLHGLESGAADWEKGAETEVNKTDRRLYDINAALQRVQGSTRLAIEQRRKAARVAAAERKKKGEQITEIIN